MRLSGRTDGLVPQLENNRSQGRETATTPRKLRNLKRNDHSNSGSIAGLRPWCNAKTPNAERQDQRSMTGLLSVVALVPQLENNRSQGRETATKPRKLRNLKPNDHSNSGSIAGFRPWCNAKTPTAERQDQRSMTGLLPVVALVARQEWRVSGLQP